MSNTNHPLSVTIAHLNDTHSYFEPSSLQLNLTIDGESVSPYVSAGGFARIASRAGQLRAEAAERQRGFLLLHAGDCFQGTLYFSLFKGEANAELLNALGIDAMTVGNHELDLGNQSVARFARRIHFPLLSGNWDLSQEDPEKTDPLASCPNVYSYDDTAQTARWMVKTIDQEPVAIFGLSLDRMDEISNPDPDTPFVLSTQVAENTVKAIREQGINKIILLSHLGYEADLQLAESVSGISLIIGGHSHILQGDYSDIGLDKADPYGVRIGQTYIVQSGLHSLALGHCHIDFDADGQVIRFEGKNELLIGRRLFVDAARESTIDEQVYAKAEAYLAQHPLIATCPKHPEIQDILHRRYLPVVRQQEVEKITILENALHHTRIPDAEGGSEIAPLVAESFVYVMKQQGFPVDFAIHNAGGVRCSLPAGNITVADVAGKLLPFAIPIGVYFITGETLLNTLEGAIDNALDNGVIGTGTGSYPYCYGLDFHYDPDQPAGKRIYGLKIYRDNQWINVEKSDIYCGTSSAYTMKGKEGYDAIVNVVRPKYISQYSMADAFIEWLKDCAGSLAVSEPREISRSS
ncbi:NAD 5'-nucleotidase precursor [Vibrio aerogenes CECT 7868]|uniref:NAD 5'-nucleotidase n=1 Tax=Vibrio aerogenes CECT 7868 TaxID=1216006 RepID=A0A1M5ZK98_9VIBR|nr:bifunctional metallophosphatase/5'-nucleotidase [Vibrio aerogenes]SHI24660.1 NAD 5'-nucleotidase precursor [Vibrio aerogenes CECT 7868]